MKPNSNNHTKFLVTGGLMVLTSLAISLQNHKVEAAARLMSRDPEFRQPNQLPRTDPELNSLDSLKQQQANFVRKQQFNMGNNGQDVAPLNQYPMRQQQQSLQKASSYQFPLQFEDEHAMGRQLLDLIAQAHTDKTLERALLKMVINASLRSALTNAASSDSAFGWRPDGNELGVGLDGGLPLTGGPRVSSARLEQVIDDFAGIDPKIANELAGQPAYTQDAQYPTVIGKREYLKPCFFNAVACAKNPFRETS